MSHTAKPKSFYAEQLFKLKNKAKAGDELTPKAYEKYYDGYLNRDGRVSPSPIIGITEVILRNRPSRWKLAKKPQPTKPCAQCGEMMEKELKMSLQTWEGKKHCSITCRKLKYETMPNVSHPTKKQS